MQKFAPKFLSSKISIVGLFAGLILVLSVPVLVLLSQQRQDLRGKAAELSPTPQAPATGTKVVSGYVYHDNNKDGEREPGEQAFPGVTVRIKQIQDPGVVGDQGQVATTTDVKTDTNGYFRYRLPGNPNDSTSYSVKVILPDTYKTITTNPVILADIAHTAQDIIEFGLFPMDDLPGTAPAVTTAPTQIQSGQTQPQSGQKIRPQRTQEIRTIQGQ